jgi:hypothetical protein
MPGSAHTPTLVSGNRPPGQIAAPDQATQRPGQLPRGLAPPAMPGVQVASAVVSTPIPMLAPSVVPDLAIGSVPAPPFAHASVASSTRISPVPNRGRRVLLALLAMLAACGLAFGIVMAMRGGEVASPPDAAAPVATAPDAAVTTPMTVRADAVIAPVDAALAPVVSDAIVSAPPVAATKRTRDAGVARSRDAGATDAAAPDAGVAPDAAVKPIDDGDGLLPSKGRSR